MRLINLFWVIQLCISLGCNSPINIIEKRILNNAYFISINTDKYNFKTDSSRIYIGNEDLIYLYNDDLKIGLEIIVGRSNPSPNYFTVLNFDNPDPEAQFSNNKYKKFISSSTFASYQNRIYSIYYIEDNELEKVESQFVAIDSLIVNTRMIRNLEFANKNRLVTINKKILKGIEIKRRK